MKKTIATIGCILLTSIGFAQSKNAKVQVEVKGNCGMCKSRIEKAAFSVKGVKDAKWDESTLQLSLVLDETKTDLKKVEEAVTKAGHDTGSMRAEDEVYTNLHGCCKYERD